MKFLITLILGISIGYIGGANKILQYKKGTVSINVKKTKQMIKHMK